MLRKTGSWLKNKKARRWGLVLGLAEAKRKRWEDKKRRRGQEEKKRSKIVGLGGPRKITWAFRGTSGGLQNYILVPQIKPRLPLTIITLQLLIMKPRPRKVWL